MYVLLPIYLISTFFSEASLKITSESSLLLAILLESYQVY